MSIERVNLHHLTKVEAKLKLNSTLNSLSNRVREVVVIHGYQGGTILKDFVRSYSHPKIERKIYTLNAGQTIFLIKNKL